MEVQIAVAKTNKYASRESGDTVEIVERPGGGLSIVMADGQSSGHGAKRISNMVVRKVISLLAEGVRDGAAARAASDYLYNERQGKVSATLNIVSVDLRSRTVVATRNNPAPILISVNGIMTKFDDACTPIGLYHNTRPSIREIPLENNLTFITYTDGLTHAGSRTNQPMPIIDVFKALLEQNLATCQGLADGLLHFAIELDQGRPVDDITVAVISVQPSNDSDSIRRLTASIPI